MSTNRTDKFQQTHAVEYYMTATENKWTDVHSNMNKSLKYFVKQKKSHRTVWICDAIAVKLSGQKPVHTDHRNCLPVGRTDCWQRWEKNLLRGGWWSQGVAYKVDAFVKGLHTLQIMSSMKLVFIFTLKLLSMYMFAYTYAYATQKCLVPLRARRGYWITWNWSYR